MSTALNSAVSGLDAYQEQMDIIGNNIANLNTVGFKSATGNLANAFSDTLQAATAAAGNDNATNAMQIGTGVFTGSITNDWSQGGINTTNNPSNLYINGNGFFIVQNPTTGAQYATQDGTFTLNAAGYLIQSTTGMEVVGLNGTAAGPIQINTTGMPSTSNPTSTMTSFTINAQGVITVNLSDGTSFVRGQVMLQNFTDPQALLSVGSNLYSNLSSSSGLSGGSAGGLTAPIAAGSGSLVNTTIVSGALELSNVDLASQMADLIVAQRAFEANSKIVTTSDEMLQTVVNMKR
jgi:flagellar hook protein FlgE